MRKGGNHATTTDSSETETPQGNNACRDASSWVRMIINWIRNNTNCFVVYMISSDEQSHKIAKRASDVMTQTRLRQTNWNG